MVSVRSTGAQEVVAVVDVPESLGSDNYAPTCRPRRRDRGAAVAAVADPPRRPGHARVRRRQGRRIRREDRRQSVAVSGGWNPDLLSQHLQRELGAVPQRASVTFLGAEPIDVLRFADVDAGCLTYVTAGASRAPDGRPGRPQPRSGPGPARRGGHAADTAREAGLRNLHKALAMIAAAPMVEGLVLGPDALVDLGAPLWDGAPFTAVLLAQDELAPLELSAPAEAIPLLRAVPVTANGRHGFASKVPRRCARRGPRPESTRPTRRVAATLR